LNKRLLTYLLSYLLACLLAYLLTYLLTPRNTVLLEKLTGSKLVKKFPTFMEPEGLLPHLQVPATCPYPEPAQSSSCPTSHFLKIQLNIIFPSTPGSSKWSLSLRFSNQNPVYTSLLPRTCHMTSPFHSSRFYRPNNIG